MTDTATSNGTTAETVVPNGWTIRWEGYEWRSTETSAQQICAIAELLGVWDWSVARPDGGPRQLVTWIAVLWTSEEADQSVQESVLRVMAQPLSVVLAAFSDGV